MTLGEAIEILKVEKEMLDRRIAGGVSSENEAKKSEAIEVTMNWVDKMYTALARLK